MGPVVVLRETYWLEVCCARTATQIHTCTRAHTDTRMHTCLQDYSSLTRQVTSPLQTCELVVQVNVVGNTCALVSVHVCVFVRACVCMCV